MDREQELAAQKAILESTLENIDLQQIATAEILRAISNSPADSQPVFDTIVRAGLGLFAGAAVAIALVDGKMIRAAAVAESDPERAQRWIERFPLPLTRDYMHGAAILERKVVDVPDVRDAPAEWSAGARNFLASGYLAVTIMPLLRGDQAIGALSVVRKNPGPLTAKQHAALSTFTEQALIAIENARLFNEIRESLEQQSASAEVLRVISSSIGDTAPVFDKIVESCERLFAGRIVGLNLVDPDGLIRMGVYHGPGREGLEKIYPLPLARTNGSAIAILDRRVVHYADVGHDADVPEATRIGCDAIGIKSVLFAPLLWEGRGIGAIFVGRERVSPFSEKEIALVKTFADQAAIGIENARLFRELEQRNRDVSEALEQQTATAEILRVISGSPTTTAPVFEAILTSSAKLCDADMGLVLRYEDGVYQTIATLVPDPAFDAFLRQPINAGPMSGLGRVAASKGPVHIPDLVEDAAYAARDPLRMRSVELGGVRTWLGVPMLREGELIGAIAIYRKEVRPFDPRQVEVLRTFADQAVIAIENVRLFNETKEALETQTATAEILKVISESPTDVQPVFDAIAERARILCSAIVAGVTRFDGEWVHLVSYRGAAPEAEQAMRDAFPMRPGGQTLTARAIRDRAPAQSPDVLADPEFGPKQAVTRAGSRSILAVPMLKDGAVIGSIGVNRAEVGVFPERQVRLLQTFADQAVIAIENVRLFNQTQEALETQTATGDILKVISESPTDVQPVFDAIAERAKVLCNAVVTGVARYDGEWVHLVAYHGVSAEADHAMRSVFPMRAGRQSASARAVEERVPVQIPDVLADPNYGPRDAARHAGYRANLAVPMLKEGHVIGAIVVCRAEPGPFPEKQVKLLQTFADQAVIAIENVRLFNELREKSEQLERASRHKSEFLANMSHELRTPLNAIIGFTRIVMRRSKEALDSKQYENLQKILQSGQNLLALINSILDLAKVEAGRVEINPSELVLGALLDDCARTIEPLLDESRVRLVKAFDATQPRMVVDEEKLRQIMINLLSNAAKFTSEGSICVECAHDSDSVTVAVRDTGIGIAADKLDTIFEEFEQAGATDTEVQRGTGLGLTIARRLARLMGGDIAAASTRGAGSTFTLTLPLRYAGAVAQEAA